MPECIARMRSLNADIVERVQVDGLELDSHEIANETKNLVVAIDTNGDGNISFDEFERYDTASNKHQHSGRMEA